MSRNALAFISGLGTGYVEQTEKNKDRERQDRKDAQDAELHDARMQEFKDAKTKKKAMADAYAPTTVNENAATLDVSGKPVLYEDAGVAGSDYRQARTMADQTAVPAADGTVTPAPVNAPKQTFAAGGIEYQDKASAQAGAAAYNTPEAGNTRAIAALRGTGDYQAASQMEAGITNQKMNDTTLKGKLREEAHKLRTEGIFNAMPFIRSGDTQRMMEEFNATGNTKILGEIQKTEEIRDIAGIGKIPTFNYKFKEQDANGKVNEKSFNSHDISMSLMPYKDFMTLAEQGIKAKRDEKSDARAERSLDIQERTANQGLKVSELNYEKALEENKVPSAVKLQADSVSGELKTIGTAIAKAQAEGSWSLDSPGSKQLLERQGVLNIKMQSLLSPYAPKSGAGVNADPIGMRGGKPNASEAQMKVNVSGDIGASPAQYQQEINAATAQLQGVTDPASRKMLTDHISSLKQTMATHFQGGGQETQPGVVQPVQGARVSPPQAAAPVAVARPTIAPPAAAVPAQAPKIPIENVAIALGATGTNTTMDQIVQAKLPAFDAAIKAITSAKVQMAATAKSGDSRALQTYSQQVMVAKANFDTLLKDMNPQMADKIRQAAGYYQ